MSSFAVRESPIRAARSKPATIPKNVIHDRIVGLKFAGNTDRAITATIIEDQQEQ
jgi:hypothetical protein